MFRPARAFPSRSERFPDRVAVLALAVAAYLPMLLTAPGRISADTKTYLTLDPGGLLRQAPSMWDPSVGAGTVPHQNIGYLFPLGPFYWLMEQVAVPDWLTQRLIWGTLVFAAACGVFKLARWLGFGVSGALVAAASYGFSPYLLSYLARLSVILGPWAALPWMILLAARAVRTRSWRPAAQFALVVALVGSVNATALVLVGLGPVLWLFCDVVVGRARVGATLAAAGRIGLTTLAVSLWWIVALRVQGTYGMPILRYTETYQAVAGASTPAEILRGLGYWFFYGGDRLDAWVGPSGPYTQTTIVIAVGFTVAGIALLGLLTAFSRRITLTVMLVIGLGVSVGAAPLGASTPYGRFFEWFANETTAGLALRSTPRAAPLVLLPLAFGLAAGCEWVRGFADRARDRRGLLLPALAIGLVVVQIFPWFTGRALTPSLLRDGELPGYETDLASWLDTSDRDGRVYELPAADFAYYRWGGTVDPVLPGLIERPYLSRELVPQGSEATADLLNAFERRLPEGWFEPEALVGFAGVVAAETVVVRNDLEHERFRLARPGVTWTDVTSALGEPDHAGEVVVDTPRIPILDERTLAHPDAAAEFPAVAAFDLEPVSTVRTVPTAAPVVVAGSGDGIVDLAASGLLGSDRPILYAASLDDLAVSGELRPEALGLNTWWVLTDTNRKQGRHWSTISSNLGAIESRGPLSLDDDPGDNRLNVFAPGVDRQTHAVHEGDVADVRASYYGNRIAYTPEDAPWFAIDGDPTTAWRAGVFDTTDDLAWEVDLRAPSTADHVTILQPTTGAINRFITAVEITLDNGAPMRATLDETSRRGEGQRVELPGTPFTSLRIDVVSDNVGPLADYGAQPGVGLAEITLQDVADDRVVLIPGVDDFTGLPTDDIASQRLSVVLTRDRIDPATSNRTSPEPRLVRRFSVPDDRPFVLTGEVRLSAAASDTVLLSAVPAPISAIADRRLAGSPASAGASAVDGDPTTAWQTPFDDVVGATLTIPDTLGITDSISVTWVDDGQHSVPVELTITAHGGSSQTIAVPPTSPGPAGRSTATIGVQSMPPGTMTVAISAISERTAPEYFSGLPQVLPVGIAELVFDGSMPAARDLDVPIDERCRDDVLLLDGNPLPVRLSGTAGEALTRQELVLEACGSVALDAGSHRIDVVDGSRSGFDVDRLVFDGVPPDAPPPPATFDAGSVSVNAQTSTSFDLTVSATSEPVWLILEQSWNLGWRAQLDGIDLGAPTLIGGYANGWILPAADEARDVELRWTPQGPVDLSLWFSLFAGITVAGIALWPLRRGRDVDTSERWAGLPPHVLGGLFVIAAIAFAGLVPAFAGCVAGIVGRRWPRVPPLMVLACGAVVASSVLVLAWRRDYPADPDWPSRFAWTSPLAWTAVITVAATATATALWRTSGSDARSADR